MPVVGSKFFPRYEVKKLIQECFIDNGVVYAGDWDRALKETQDWCWWVPNWILR